MENIFQAAETLIHTNALGKNQVKNAAYACFDSFNGTKKILSIWEAELCRAFQWIIEEYKIQTTEILEFVDNLDYNLLFVKKACLLNLQNYNLDSQFSVLQMVEYSWLTWILRVNTSYFEGERDMDYEIELENSLWIELRKKLDIHNNCFEFYYDWKNTSEMYSFIASICYELQKGNDYGKIDVSEFTLEFEWNIHSNIRIFKKIYYYFEKFWVAKEVLELLSDWKIDRFTMEIYADSHTDDSYDIAEFSWTKNLLEILTYLEDLDQTYWSVKLVIEEILTD